MGNSRKRFLQDLFAGMTLSIVNLLGAFLTLSAAGGLGQWSSAQFIGLFGTIEVATGVAFMFTPNIWRLPIAEAKLTRHDVKFAASTVFLPHWAGAVKASMGLIFVVYAAVTEGIGSATPGLLAVVVAVTASSFGLSMIVARLGTLRPDIDVYWIIVRRPGHEDRQLPDISLGASLVQILLSIGTFPAVKLMHPNVLYRPEIGPSQACLGWCLAIGAMFLAAGALAWFGRLTWRAVPAQQHDAEQAVQAG